MMFRRPVRPPRAKPRRSSWVTPSTSPSPPPRGLERVGDGGEEVAQRLADDVGHLGVRADGLAQVPDAVADVARLVVVDERVAVDETAEEVVLAQVVGDELERRQAERALEDLVVERDEADLRGEVAGRGDQLFVVTDEDLVEDLAEGVGDALAGAVDVGGDDLRLADDLVLEARVELHVARLVDLLGGEEGGLLLGAVGADEAAE